MTVDCWPDKKDYDILYRKWVQKPADTLLRAADLHPGESVLDLCCGGMRQSKAAVEMGASVVHAVDNSTQMCPKDYDYNIKLFPIAVETFFYHYTYKYDVIVCQQAANYWLNDEHAYNVLSMLFPGGRFVFNTFVNKPPMEPTFKAYTIGDRTYGEAFYLVGGMVEHIQMCDGFPSHHSTFPWIDADTYTRYLSSFDVQVTINGNSAIYVCKKLS